MWHEKDDGWIASIILTKFFKMSFIIQSRINKAFRTTTGAKRAITATQDDYNN
jgi:hypothetical protein